MAFFNVSGTLSKLDFFLLLLRLLLPRFLLLPLACWLLLLLLLVYQANDMLARLFEVDAGTAV